MAFWVYILRRADGKYYTGQTDDLERRIAQHLLGGFCNFTSRWRPVQLIWSEAVGTRDAALAADLRVKKWSRVKKEALAVGDWEGVSFFARPPGESVSILLDTNGKVGGTDTEAALWP
jgi:predicted GIY-YIG superfamily endonuclease